MKTPETNSMYVYSYFESKADSDFQQNYDNVLFSSQT